MYSNISFKKLYFCYLVPDSEMLVYLALNSYMKIIYRNVSPECGLIDSVQLCVDLGVMLVSRLTYMPFSLSL